MKEEVKKPFPPIFAFSNFPTKKNILKRILIYSSQKTDAEELPRIAIITELGLKRFIFT